MDNGCVIEYGGFMMNQNTGKEELLCITQLSKSDCMKSAIKLAEFYNRSSIICADYDIDSLRIRYRKLEEYVGPWREEEKSAFIDSAYEYKEDPGDDTKKWLFQKIRKENLTSSSRVTCRWTDQGQFVGLDYNVDSSIDIALDSDVLFAELYEDGSPCRETWEDAICIARYVSRKLGIPINYK